MKQAPSWAPSQCTSGDIARRRAATTGCCCTRAACQPVQQRSGILWPMRWMLCASCKSPMLWLTMARTRVCRTHLPSGSQPQSDRKRQLTRLTARAFSRNHFMPGALGARAGSLPHKVSTALHQMRLETPTGEGLADRLVQWCLGRRILALSRGLRSAPPRGSGIKWRQLSTSSGWWKIPVRWNGMGTAVWAGHTYSNALCWCPACAT